MRNLMVDFRISVLNSTQEKIAWVQRDCLGCLKYNTLPNFNDLTYQIELDAFKLLQRCRKTLQFQICQVILKQRIAMDF